MDIAKVLNDLTNNDLLGWKTALATVIVLLAAFQVALSGRFWAGGGLPFSPVTAATVHRWNGRLVLLLSVVIGYACLMGPAGVTTPVRLLVHSILGATLFALLCAKILAVRVIATSDKMLPIIGTALFANYLLIWFVTVADYVTSANVNPPPSAALQVWVWVLSSIAGVLGGIGIFAFLRSRTGGTKPKQSAPAAIAE